MGGPTKPKKIASIRKDPLYKAGYDDGARDMMKKSLTWLEKKYLHPSLDTSSVEAKAILELAQKLAMHLRGDDEEE